MSYDYECTLVGKTFAPAGMKWVGKVTSTRLVGGMLIAYFENGYCCNAHVCRLVEDEE